MTVPARILLASTVIAVALATPTGARATVALPTAAPAVDQPLPRGRWYGWELILTDALLLLVAGDGFQEKPELGLSQYQFQLALGAVVVGAPVLHYIHGNRRRAMFGLLVRSAAVGLYALAAAELNDSSSSSGADGEAGIDLSPGDVILAFLATGGVISAGVFAFIDSFWFSRVPAPARATAMIVPTFFMRASGGGLGLAGTF